MTTPPEPQNDSAREYVAARIEADKDEVRRRIARLEDQIPDLLAAHAEAWAAVWAVPESKWTADTDAPGHRASRSLWRAMDAIRAAEGKLARLDEPGEFTRRLETRQRIVAIPKKVKGGEEIVTTKLKSASRTRSGEGQVSSRRAAEAVLRRARGPLSLTEITERVLATPGVDLPGKTPHATVAKVLSLETQRPDGFAVRVGPATYDLRERSKPVKNRRKRSERQAVAA